MLHLWRAVVGGFGRRIGYAVAMVLLAALSTQCHAYGTVTASGVPTTGYYTCSGTGISVAMPVCSGSPPTSGGIGGYPYFSVSAMCDAYRAWVATNPGVTGATLITCPGVGGVMRVDGTYSGATYSATSSVISATYSVTSCPSNSTSAGGSDCTCNLGYKPSGSSCVSIGSCVDVISAAVSGWEPNNYLQVPTLDVTQCHGGCVVRGEFVVQGAEGTFMAGPQPTGAYCQGTSGTGTTIVDVWPDPVPPGKCPGEVEGEPVVVDCTGTQSGTQSETVNPDTSTTTTDKKTTCIEGQGCTTTATVTECSASAVCTSTVTVTHGFDLLDPASGGSGSGGVGGGAGEDPCAANPTRAGCSVLGDADADPIGEVERSVSITPDTGWAHDDTCPADKVLSLAHVTLTVPFTLLCDAADMAKPIVVAVAWLTAIGGFFGLSRRSGD